MFNNNDYPLPLMIDSKIDEDALLNIRKNKEWLVKKFSEYNYELKDILYAFYKKGKIYIVKK